ncbi:MAG: flagellar hook-basal body complex protein FliE [Oscillospiraceae bacterium]|jgi:flagellar hook-basal body complex protein FliE|nr:flagellar hook-basal body complex protein FliE [Oscillospiraceae bacterium]
MEIGRISDFSIPRPAPLSGPTETQPKASFSDFLGQALSSVVTTDAADKQTGFGTLLDTVPDIHTATIAAQEAEIALNLTLQIRNKIIESYQEIMRMQI